MAVSTFHRSSGVAKLIRADRSGLPVRHARAKSAMDSPASRTSRVTVFTVPPRDIALEGCEKCLRRSEGVGRFLVPEVTMITLADFVVVTDHADTADDASKAVLECQHHRLLSMTPTVAAIGMPDVIWFGPDARRTRGAMSHDGLIP